MLTDQWLLHSQDSLHSGPHSPVTLGAPDITALLPCDEDDFAAGLQPTSRAALPDSPPAIANPALVCDPGRSLFASLMQIDHYWGIISRRAATLTKDAGHPWDVNSQFCILRRRLREWEDGLPAEHRWAAPQLHWYKYRKLDLVSPAPLSLERQELTGIQAYLSVTMMPRLCHIVLRRIFLVEYATRAHDTLFTY